MVYDWLALGNCRCCLQGIAGCAPQRGTRIWYSSGLACYRTALADTALGRLPAYATLPTTSTNDVLFVLVLVGGVLRIVVSMTIDGK
jgi:hypothetical protein